MKYENLITESKREAQRTFQIRYLGSVVPLAMFGRFLSLASDAPSSKLMNLFSHSLTSYC